MSKYSKFLIFIGVSISILAIATPVFLYINNFHNHTISTDPTYWGVFGDYFGGILNPIISLLTLLVTILIAINISKIEQRNHEETVHNPVKPFFVIGDGYFYSADTSEIGLSVEKDYYDYNAQNIAGPYDHLNKSFYLKISNKGLGVSAEVVVTFEIDLTELTKAINIKDPKINTTVSEIRKDEDGREFIVLKIDAEEHFHYKVLFSKIMSKEIHGLGVIEKDKEVTVNLPSQIMAAFQLQNLLRKLQDGEFVFPIIFVTLDYKNIFGKEMSSKYKVGLFHVRDYSNYTLYRISQEQV